MEKTMNIKSFKEWNDINEKLNKVMVELPKDFIIALKELHKEILEEDISGILLAFSEEDNVIDFEFVSPTMVTIQVNHNITDKFINKVFNNIIEGEQILDDDEVPTRFFTKFYNTTIPVKILNHKENNE